MDQNSVAQGDGPTLTPLEQVSPRFWVRYIFLFQLPDNYEPVAIARILRAGLEATIQRFPALGCEVVPDPASKQAGVVKLQILERDDFPSITFKDLRGPGGFRTTYAALKAKSFPVSAFNPAQLCRTNTWPMIGHRVPVALAQANFITGGLILNWCLFHTVGDGKTFFNWTRAWSEECRRLQGMHVPCPSSCPDQIFKDRVMAMSAATGSEAGRLEDHPEFAVLTEPSNQLPKLARIATSEGRCGCVFSFSPQALVELKKDASPVNPSDSRPSYVSTNDALSALVWRTILATSLSLDMIDDNEISVFNMSMDCRLRIHPRIHPETQGSFLGPIAVELPIRHILAPTSLPDVAMQIRKAVLATNSQRAGAYINNINKLILNQSDVSLMVPSAMPDLLERNCVVTTWSEFPLYDLDWGSTIGDRIDAVRSPSDSFMHGLQTVLPKRHDGRLEVLVNIDSDCLPKLMNDPLWNRYATCP